MDPGVSVKGDRPHGSLLSFVSVECESYMGVRVITTSVSSGLSQELSGLATSRHTQKALQKLLLQFKPLTKAQAAIR